MSDGEPGFRRLRRGRGFAYLDAEGGALRDRRELARIRALAIPPAYREVWICPQHDGHLQATARDERGRKQYRYHPGFRAHRESQKFAQLAELGAALPRVRRRVARDLRRRGLPREKVLAIVVRLLDRTLARVGNEEYARHNGSFGLTTLRDRHARISGERLELDFRGKSGVAHHFEIDDAHAARIVERCRALPGTTLFQYLDGEGRRRSVSSADVNEYLRAAAGADLTAKDFRTWAASALALHRLCGLRRRSRRQAQRLLAETVAEVAERLGNSPAVCRRSYIDPRIPGAFLSGELEHLRSRSPERTLLSFLRRHADCLLPRA